MKPARTSLLLHPLFITSLLVLLLNDQYWKAAYSNWLTGKLSDFAGLIVFTVLASTFFPLYRKAIFWGTALFFIWFKSAWSQPFLDLMADYLHITWDRVVDYSDLVALFILPLAYRIKPVPVPMKSVKPALLGLLGIAALYADTPPRYMQYGYEPGRYTVNGSFKRNMSKEAVINKFLEKGYVVTKDSGQYLPLMNNRMFLKIKDSTGERMVPLQNYPDLSVYNFIEPYSNSYFISSLALGKDTLRNVYFTLDEKSNRKKTKTKVVLWNFSYLPDSSYAGRRATAQKFKKPLKQALEDILND
jgi:hypothetical protein